MKGFFVITAAFAALVYSSTFEPSHFSITAALRSHSVNTPAAAILKNSSDYCSCVSACLVLSAHYGNGYLIPANTSAYTQFQDAYWSSIQTDVRPVCIFLPPDANAVSVLVLVSRLTQCPFAVKSGGHSAFAGAASSPGGITVSLQYLNEISLSNDKKIAYVGPGNTWKQVYSKLAENEVTVVGGRVSNIGVGGLTLGGGISFFSGFHGWALDNVEEYEVVAANGQQIRATPTEHPDLYWALRGGGNNFGIVTRFHLRTIDIPGNVVWGGTRTYLESSFSSIVQAFTNLTFNAKSDPRAGYWAAFGEFNGTKFCSSTLWYSNATNINNTNIFAEYNKVPSLTDTTRVQNLVDFVVDIQQGNPPGFREVYWAFTTKASVELANYALEEFFAALPTIINIPGILPIFIFQPITVPQIVNMGQNGGNALGLNPDDGPLFLLSVPIWWLFAVDDTKIYTFISNLQRKIVIRAKQMGLENDYIYMNYASQFQDVIRGYGAANKARLIQIAKEYDPEQVFQLLQPGYFKLDRAPVESDYFTGNWS